MDKRNPESDEINLEECNFSTDKSSPENYLIKRPVYSQYEFDLIHEINTEKQSLKNQLIESTNKFKKQYCSKEKFHYFIYGKFPFISIISNYKWKEWFLEDFITGLIVGIMHIPQGMAYSQLAGLRPVHGLYVSLFPSLIYFFLGTSKHISIGSMAIASLMTNKFLEKSLIDFPLQTVHNITTDYNTANDEIESLISSRAAGFAFFVGITQLFMGFCNMGSLTRYLSDPIISGFTVGSSVHVFASQIKYCFGVEIQTFYGIFNVINTITEVFMKIPETNVPTISITIICISLLGITKEIINPYVMTKIRCPVPTELFVVIAGIFSSEYFMLHKNHKVLVIGEISKGLPAPTVPDINISYNYVGDIIITAVIAFAVSVSLAKIFSKKHGYKINSNQEFLAYGIMNIFASFFSCFPSSASLSRSAVQESVGGKTQLSSIVSSSLLILVLFIGQFFENLPSCILASIIIVALKGIFMQFGELKDLWFFSILDFSIWVTTFLGTVLLDVEYGLLIGVILSFFSAVLRTQSPNSQILGQIYGTDIYRDISLYTECKEIPGIKIFRYEGSLYYACCEHFRNSLYSKIKCDPRELYLDISNLKDKLCKLQKKEKNDIETDDFTSEKLILEQQLDNLNKSNRFHIIIDCSNWEYIDIMGMKTLNQIIEEFNNVNIPVLLANPKSDIQKMFYRFRSSSHINDKIIYLSVHDAVISCLFQHNSGQEKI